jgi:uncharacterized protein (TIGR00661 family)
LVKILYGVQGTGNGHINRTRMMAKHFAQRDDVEVTYLFSGRGKDSYFDMAVFGDYLCRQGLTFYVDSGKLNYLRTLRHNNFVAFVREMRALQLQLDQFDLVITDFEPITAWAARLGKKKLLGLGHQYAFAYNIPREGENFISRLLMRNFAPANSAFGLHWDSFGGLILPPIVDPDLTRRAGALHREAEKIIVYLPFENQQLVTDLLQQIPHYRFFQYSAELTDSQVSNVSLRKTCHEGFVNDLCSSRAVLCNAGFELVSEAIQLGLDILVKPLQGQPEQLSNAAALVELQLGRRLDQLTPQGVSDWLSSLTGSGHTPAPSPYPDVAKSLVHWIIDPDKCQAETLAKRLWSEYRNSVPGETVGSQAEPREAHC